MSAYNPSVPLGSPGSFPLPIKGEAGSAFTGGMMHPAANAANASRQNPLNALAPAQAPGLAPAAGGKK